MGTAAEAADRRTPRFPRRPARDGPRHHRRSQESLAQQGHPLCRLRPRPHRARLSNPAARRRSPFSPTRRSSRAALPISKPPARPIQLPVLRKDFTIDVLADPRSRGARRRRHPADRRDPRRTRDPRFPRDSPRAIAWRRWSKSTTARELDVAIAAGADLIGVNNRDLTTFEVTLETSLRSGGAHAAGRAARERKRHSRRARISPGCAPPGSTRFWWASI